MSERFRRSGPLSVFWLGLFWVWSAIPWFFFGLGLLATGAPLSGAAALLHMVGAVVVGVGLSASEAWGWASAACLSGFYVVGGLALLAAIGWAVAIQPPGALSWQPVFAGLPREASLNAAGIAALVAVLGLVNLYLLWRNQPSYHVPERRPFTTMVRRGLVAALPMFGADLWILFRWWSGTW